MGLFTKSTSSPIGADSPINRSRQDATRDTLDDMDALDELLAESQIPAPLASASVEAGLDALVYLLHHTGRSALGRARHIGAALPAFGDQAWQHLPPGAVVTASNRAERTVILVLSTPTRAAVTLRAEVMEGLGAVRVVLWGPSMRCCGAADFMAEAFAGSPAEAERALAWALDALEQTSILYLAADVLGVMPQLARRTGRSP